MSDAPADPRCPECGGKIGMTATYCMHCSADLTAERAAADLDDDGTWDVGTGTGTTAQEGSATDKLDSLLDVDGVVDEPLAPDGVLDDTLTVLVGIGGGLVVGVLATIVLAMLTGSGWALLVGVAAWLVATAYLVRRSTVQGAVAATGYAVAVALLLVPLVALSPAVEVDGGVGERGALFAVLLVFVAVPAGVAAVIGWVASRFRPQQ